MGRSVDSSSARVSTYRIIAHELGGQPDPFMAGNPSVIEITLGRLVGRYADIMAFALWGSAAGLVALLLFKALLRRTWLAVLFMAVAGGTIWTPALNPSYPVLAAIFMSTSYIAWAWTLNRFGMLASVVAVVTYVVSTGAASSNPSPWYGPNFLLGAALILALAVYGSHFALAGRPLFPGTLLAEEETAGKGKLV